MQHNSKVLRLIKALPNNKQLVTLEINNNGDGYLIAYCTNLFMYKACKIKTWYFAETYPENTSFPSVDKAQALIKDWKAFEFEQVLSQ